MKNHSVLHSVKSMSTVIRSKDVLHQWRFSRVGGVNRVNLLNGTDILALEQLDQKLWTVLSCPVHGLELDPKTLELIDSDHDDRIRVREVLEAVHWICSILKNPDDLLKGSVSLPLSAINDETAEGKELLASARRILINLGMSEKTEITVEETSDTAHIFANSKFNGDGIITEDSVENAGMKKLIADIIDCQGSVMDRSGKPGITADSINAFYQNCEEYSAWQAIKEEKSSSILTLGDQTGDALEAFLAVKVKIDDYFLRCRLAEFDPVSLNVLNVVASRYEVISPKDLTACNDEISSLPIARIDLAKGLPLYESINPAWEQALEKFREMVVNPLFPEKKHLTRSEWESIPRKFDEYNNWMAVKKGTTVEKLGLTAIREIVSGKKKDELLALVEKDVALKSVANNIFKVDQLTRYYRDLYTLLKNFVNFSDFYSPDVKAVFQAGQLYIDQRCCDLCIKVSDMPKHNSIAGSSGICLLYCDCTSKIKNEKMTIVAALTDGDVDNISVGRNAIFYDRQGGDWDATIVKIIDNPISIRQAFWLPYVKISKFISSQIEKFASSKEKQVEATTTTHAAKVTSKMDEGISGSIQSQPSVPAGPPPQPFDIGKFVGIFAAIGLALGAIGSMIVSVATGFFNLQWWQMPLAIAGLILIISLPSMIIAYLKLRKRNLAPVLDANGWAINARLTVNIIFGKTLTHLVTLPPNAKIDLIDPFSKKKKPIVPIILTIIVLLGIAGFLLWRFGLLEKWGLLDFSKYKFW